jgi:hypothetical protein
VIAFVTVTSVAFFDLEKPVQTLWKTLQRSFWDQHHQEPLLLADGIYTWLQTLWKSAYHASLLDLSPRDQYGMWQAWSAGQIHREGEEVPINAEL